MSRIPDELIERLKQTSNLVAVIKNRGVKLRKTGRIYKGRCPFHQEKTASFTITPTERLWHCLGCHKGGNVIQFVQWFDQVSFPEAFKRLGGYQQGDQKPSSPGSPSRAGSTAKPPTVNPTQRTQLLTRVENFYQKCFANRPEGMKCLVKQRGIKIE